MPEVDHVELIAGEIERVPNYPIERPIQITPGPSIPRKPARRVAADLDG
jgi:hypothetical protein